MDTLATHVNLVYQIKDFPDIKWQHSQLRFRDLQTLIQKTNKKRSRADCKTAKSLFFIHFLLIGLVTLLSLGSYLSCHENK